MLHSHDARCALTINVTNYCREVNTKPIVKPFGADCEVALMPVCLRDSY